MNFVDARFDSLRELALFEEWRDGFADDAFGFNIRQCALPAVADLDAQLFLFHRDDEDGARVRAFFPDFPGFSDANAILVDGLGLGGFDDEYGELPTCGLFERGEFCFERLFAICAENARSVGNAGSQRRDGRVVLGES